MFYTRFSPNPVRNDYVEDCKSQTQQHYLQKSDINWIVQHYAEIPETGIMSTVGPRMPLWGDFSTIPDPLTAHNVFVQAEASFGALPAVVRQRFNNDPVQFLAFCSDPGNRDEAKKLGLCVPDPDPDPMIKKADTVASVNAETIAAAPSA